MTKKGHLWLYSMPRLVYMKAKKLNHPTKKQRKLWLNQIFIYSKGNIFLYGSAALEYVCHRYLLLIPWRARIWEDGLFYWLRTHFWLRQAAAPTPIRAQPRGLLAEIDGPTRRPLLRLTLMRCVLNGITAFKGADGGGAQCAPVESALVLNADSNE